MMKYFLKHNEERVKDTQVVNNQTFTPPPEINNSVWFCAISNNIKNSTMKNKYFSANPFRHFKAVFALFLTVVFLFSCTKEVTIPPSAPSLTFQKVTEEFTSGGIISTTEILRGVRGTKTGYVLKSVSNLDPYNIVNLSGSAPNLYLIVKKIGSFSATIVLKHPTKPDVTIANCVFEITISSASSLTFQKVSKPFTSGGKFTTADILSGVRGNKTGYTIKSITSLSPSNLVTVSASKELKFSGGFGGFTASIVLEHPTKATVTIANCAFEITNSSASLTFQKVSKPFASGGIFTTADILSGVRGTKTGYVLKSVSNLDPYNIVNLSGSAPNLYLIVKKIGAFTATIVLEHPTKPDVTIANCVFEITISSASSLTFQKVSKPFTSGGKFTTADILSGVRGNKTGYTIKSITSLSPSNLVTVSASKELNFSGAFGSFTGTIVLEHPTKADVTIANCAFEITNSSASLTFQKVSKPFSSGGILTTADILSGVRGTKTGYVLKSVSNLSPYNIVNLSGSAPNLYLIIKKIGAFSATIVLEHPTKPDVTIANCVFEITIGSAPSLWFQKVSKTFTSGAIISTAEIIAGVQGSKTGYTLKSINNLAPYNIVNLSGSAPNLYLIVKKIGSFSATIVLEHPTKPDVTIANCAFEITISSASSLTFQKVSKPFTSGGKFTTADILSGVRGNKTGYTIKSITSLSPSNLVTVSASKELKFSGGFGSFTGTIVLEHPTKADVTIANCAFEITIGSASSLTFQKVSKPFTSGGKFTTADILSGVRGSKTGYTIKTITLNPTNLVTVSASKELNFRASVGSFTATIVLEHRTKADVTIVNCAFEITKSTAERLTFQKVSKPFTSGSKFTTAEILGGVQGSKTGYTIKTITLNPTNLVTVSASKELNFRASLGNFTATIVLEHPTKADVTIANCAFEITIGSAPSLTFQKVSKHFTSGAIISTAEIIAGVQGSKTGYTLKNINNLAPYDIVNLSGRAPNLILTVKKIGPFTATIVLEHPTKADVTIADCAFEITKSTAERLTFQKLSKPFTIGSKFTTADIMSSVLGNKTNYTIKNITSLSPSNLATVSASKELNFSGGFGSFTATIVLKHPTKADATITSAQFEIYSDFLKVSNDGIVSLKSGVTKSSVKNIVIPSKINNINVRSIVQSAFRDYTSFTSVTIPNSVTAIGKYAFSGCSSLTEVTIPNSVTAIADETFYKCSSLTSVTIGNSVASIGGYAFSDCSSLTAVTIPNSVTAIEVNAFGDCSSLTEVTIPNSVTAIGQNVFYGCSSLGKIHVPRAKKSTWETKLKAGNSARVLGY